MELLRYLSRELNPDLTIIAGDINVDLKHLSNSVTGKLITVSGDKDDIIITKQGKGLSVLIDGSLIECLGLRLAGVGGISIHQNLRRLTNVLNANRTKLDVLVTHFPPIYCLDFSRELGVYLGLREIREFVERSSPKLVISGYVISRGMCAVGATHVVIPGVLARGEVVVMEFGREGIKEIKFLRLNPC